MFKRIGLVFLHILLMCSGTIVALSVTRNSMGNYNIIAVFALAVVLAIVIIEIISCIKIVDSTLHTVFSSLFIFLSFLTSRDIFTVFEGFNLNLSVYSLEVVNYFCFLGIMLANLYFMDYTYKTGSSRNVRLVIDLFAILCCIFYGVGLLYGFQYIPHFIYVAVFLGLFVYIYYKVFKSGKDDATFYLSMSIFYVAIGMQTVSVLDSCGVIKYSTLYYPLVHMVAFICIFVGVYISFTIRTIRQAYEASEYKLQVHMMKARVLREQINPHFIFNCLTTVKSLYHSDLDSGDRAMSLFSNHLRTNVQAMDVDLIPFERELDNLENFIELENLRRERAFDVIYNIGYIDFLVPILSLQVYVENAIRYSKVNEIEGGYIEISSYEEGDKIIVEVNDNGVGFDVNDIMDTSFGIKNSRERFKLLLNAEIEIKSEIGSGTNVRIILNNKGISGG